ncbi:MAG: hypothetical protein KDJ48_09395 [Nitratireductor sp.]|nr:hypothetical protein [Nitratireductor sp.]MCB1454854.1 hypothetical protein [Nitratireductor sp.]MCB1459457.1 hypothetical protein [Nitratireductor sp.]
MAGADAASQALANGSTTGVGAGAGNDKLSEAFDYAIQEAQQTLTITTKKGADLYALKQRPQ